MEIIAHEFTDSLSNFLQKNPSLNEKDWMKQLDHADLWALVELLRIVVDRRGFPGLDELQSLNRQTDIHLLAFKVNNIGKKRQILSMECERRFKLIRRILVDAQLVAINPKII